MVPRLAARGSTVLPGSKAGCGKTLGASLRQGEAFVLIVVFAVSLETWMLVVRKQCKGHAVVIIKYLNAKLLNEETKELDDFEYEF